MRKKMFHKGIEFNNLNELVHWMRDMGCWVYWKDQPKHCSFIMGMSLRTIIGALSKRILFYALRND